MKKLKTGEENHRRHKCSICDRVRFEKFMKEIQDSSGWKIVTRYGNQCWGCVDNPDCLQSAKRFYTY